MNNYFVQTYTWNPWRNLAVEKYLADKIEPGDVVLYLWQNDHTVVIGRNQNAIRECKAQLLEEEGGFLARQPAGNSALKRSFPDGTTSLPRMGSSFPEMRFPRIPTAIFSMEP